MIKHRTEDPGLTREWRKRISADKEMEVNRGGTRRQHAQKDIVSLSYEPLGGFQFDAAGDRRIRG